MKEVLLRGSGISERPGRGAGVLELYYCERN
jgi:hypothetical protein